MENIATSALQTPIGLLVVLCLGFGVAFMAWTAKEEIDLFFFRMSGGNTQFGHRAALAFPLLIVALTLWFVVRGFV
jgi:hypothetical protein